MTIELQHVITGPFTPPFGLQPQRLSKEQAWDVKQVKIALNRLGFYEPDPKTGLTAETDIDFQEALQAFQMVNTIPPGDVLGPGSLTERVLNEQIAAQDPERAYIWHTVGDEKVRGAHAARNKRRFHWDNPPTGGHPGEDYGCRCWAEPVTPIHHPWIDWARQRREARGVVGEAITQSDFLGPTTGLNDLITPVPVDAINPTISPLDLIGGGFAARGLIRQLAAKFRDTRWISNTPRSKLQSKFKHAKEFDIKGNPNNKTLEAFRKALIDHVKSPDTRVIRGTYQKQSATHYYNKKTGLNLIRDTRGNFWSAWRLSKEQAENILRSGKLGGSK